MIGHRPQRFWIPTHGQNDKVGFDPFDFNVLLDSADINMVVITDSILKKGWEPDGFVQRDGYRIYRYKTASE